MAVPAELVKKLRDMTGAPMMDCKKALEEASGDMEKALTLLREKGQAALAKREGKAANEGAVISYVHIGDKIGVLVELNCETDFVARTAEFKQLGRDIAMQIAFSNPPYIDRDAVPESEAEKERQIHVNWAKNLGKPEKAIDNIVKGKMEKFYEAVCLMDQPFIKDGDVKVRDVFNDVVGKLREKVVLKRFARFRVGEEEAEGPGGPSG